MLDVFPSWLTTAHSAAIVGFGREGKSTKAFLEKYFPQLKLLIYETHQETFAISAVDILFKSPGIPTKNVHCSPETYLTSQADLFVQMFGPRTIAITGTKGKSTTAHAISHVLTAIGVKNILLGNIGKPALDFVGQMDQDTFAVFEMSAFQTESLHEAPHIAVFTSLYQEHLDYYETMAEYTQAKKHLFDLQTEEDLCIYRDDYQQIEAELQNVRAKKLGYNPGSQDYPVNYIPASIIAKNFGASTQQISQALKSIQPLPGRMEKIGTYGGITFIDDALATIPEATMLALDTTSNVATLIVGGAERHQYFTKLAQAIADSTIATLILFPTTGERIGQEVAPLRPTLRIESASSMEEAIKKAYEHTPAGKIVLLSTASPSFGLFENYADRSRQYKHWIEKLQPAP